MAETVAGHKCHDECNARRATSTGSAVKYLEAILTPPVLDRSPPIAKTSTSPRSSSHRIHLRPTLTRGTQLNPGECIAMGIIQLVDLR